MRVAAEEQRAGDPGRARCSQIAWLVAAMWSSLNARSSDEPRCPEVPKATCCAGSATSG